MWWTKERTREAIETMLKTSISFGLIDESSNDLVGYARVITDEIKYAFIFDVMVADYLRKKGLGKKLMDAILAYPRLKNVTNFELTLRQIWWGFMKSWGLVRVMGK